MKEGIKHAADELIARRKAAQRREALLANALTTDLRVFWESFVDQLKKDVSGGRQIKSRDAETARRIFNTFEFLPQ